MLFLYSRPLIYQTAPHTRAPSSAELTLKLACRSIPRTILRHLPREYSAVGFSTGSQSAAADSAAFLNAYFIL